MFCFPLKIRAKKTNPIKKKKKKKLPKGNFLPSHKVCFKRFSFVFCNQKGFLEPE